MFIEIGIQTTNTAGGLYQPNIGVAGIEYGYRFAVRGKVVDLVRRSPGAELVHYETEVL